jgi:hypothetical protein
MDVLLGQQEPHYYMVLGSGIKGVGPRIPLYSAPARNLTQWTFLGALWEPTMNQTFGDIQETGSYGFNFEVSGFFSLVCVLSISEVPEVSWELTSDIERRRGYRPLLCHYGNRRW